MTTRYFLAILVLLALVSGGAWSWLHLVDPGEPATDAAQKFLASLSSEEKATAVLPYDSPKRVDWHFIPKDTRKGLQIRHMGEAQRKLAHDLLKTLLSEAGYGKATAIMGLENLLKELEKKKTGTPLRDAERYYWTIFGDPSGKAPWGVSVEGHHLSLNFVIEGRKVTATTPTVFATNPATVMAEVEGVKVKKGTRLLADEEELAFKLYNEMTPRQKKMALIAEKAPAEIRAAGAAQPPTDAPVGVPAGRN